MHARLMNGDRLPQPEAAAFMRQVMDGDVSGVRLAAALAALRVRGETPEEIAGFAQKAKAGKLTMEDMSGGTFSITNGGTFGSMMSTPIINAPQSAILGMHNIIERPIAQNGQVVLAPMMYLALSYDHRIIDGKEAVQFLVAIKNVLEDPARMLLEI